MRVGDIVVYTGYGNHVDAGDKVRVLSFGAQTAAVHPLKWASRGVPSAFSHRKDIGSGFPYIRLRVSNLKAIEKCIFDEVVDNEI